MGIPDHLTCLLRNIYAGQEATVRTGHGTTNWFQIGKGVREGCILSPCLFNFYAEYIMRNAGLEETQAGIKIAGRYINNLSHSVVSNSLRPHESQHARPPCPSPIPGVHSGVYADYIMRNAGLEEAQAGIKIAGRNINNLR